MRNELSESMIAKYKIAREKNRFFALWSSNMNEQKTKPSYFIICYTLARPNNLQLLYSKNYIHIFPIIH